MKKIYMIPSLEVTKIETQRIIAESAPEVALSTTADPVDAASVESRRQNNLWDWDEEE
ncbi:MAG: hypothetical protein IJ081_03300 [Prevotella sp.]|nr:hypothetical protein [Prevotella sp.]